MYVNKNDYPKTFASLTKYRKYKALWDNNALYFWKICQSHESPLLQNLQTFCLLYFVNFITAIYFLVVLQGGREAGEPSLLSSGQGGVTSY